MTSALISWLTLSNLARTCDDRAIFVMGIHFTKTHKNGLKQGYTFTAMRSMELISVVLLLGVFLRLSCSTLF